MCKTTMELNEVIKAIKKLKSIKEQTEQEIKLLEKDVVDFLESNEDCKTINKNGNPVLQFIGEDFKATYEERMRESIKKEEIKKLLTVEQLSNCTSISIFNVLTIR